MPGAATNRNVQISWAPLKSQAQSTSLFRVFQTNSWTIYFSSTF